MRTISTSIARLAIIRAVAVAAVSRMTGRPVRDEGGNVITDNLAWIVFGVVAIVAIGGLLEALGHNVITWVTSQLGI